jgi:hypothetical protein
VLKRNVLNCDDFTHFPVVVLNPFRMHDTPGSLTMSGQLRTALAQAAAAVQPNDWDCSISVYRRIDATPIRLFRKSRVTLPGPLSQSLPHPLTQLPSWSLNRSPTDLALSPHPALTAPPSTSNRDTSDDRVATVLRLALMPCRTEMQESELTEAVRCMTTPEFDVRTLIMSTPNLSQIVGTTPPPSFPSIPDMRADIVGTHATMAPPTAPPSHAMQPQSKAAVQPPKFDGDVNDFFVSLYQSDSSTAPNCTIHSPVHPRISGSQSHF